MKPAYDTPEQMQETSQAQETQLTPRHVGIILDGNGRWAKARGLPRTMGHRRGVEAVRKAVAYAGEHGIGYLTLFSFSSENWNRPADEVGELMGLLRQYIRSDLKKLHKNNVRIVRIGSSVGIPEDIADLLFEAEELTSQNTGLTLFVAFNYGARDEIVRATQRLAQAVKRGDIAPEAIDETLIGQYLDTGEAPDPDLIIRTSGEQRLSNFLLWQSAYAEFVFLPLMWPDFDDAAFEEALTHYRQRQRRFGGVVTDGAQHG